MCYNYYKGDMIMPKRSFKYDVEITKEGRLDLEVPLPKGTHITVFIVEKKRGEFDDLILAANSSLDFWDNPFDDVDWNNA